ncbi:MAG: ABC transporter permease subunit [Methylobacteriaceae bacterium]|nr:ABC transporter permease subunit [Methylobacteriaceae bacterium]
MRQVLVDRLALAAVALTLWVALELRLGPDILPGPLETGLRLLGLLADPAFQDEIASTLGAFALAALLAASLGLMLGAALGTLPRTSDLLEPFLVGFYALPKVTLYPTVLLLLGVGLDAKVAFGALHGIVPVALFTAGGIRGLPPILAKSARTLGLARVATVTRVLLPAALPEILAGLRIGLALTLLGTLIGEMFAARSGLGSVLMRAIPRLDNATVLSVTILFLAGALLVDWTLERATRRSAAGR